MELIYLGVGFLAGFVVCGLWAWYLLDKAEASRQETIQAWRKAYGELSRDYLALVKAQNKVEGANRGR